MLIPRAWSRCVSRTVALTRCFSSGASAPTPKHSIYVSESTNPYFNLTFEDWLFRHKSPDEPLLLVYRDQPCVVIGRNQNPWKEVNLRASRRTGIPFIRRHSGGGTVYHDLGNTNFSIHLPRASFDRHATAQVVMRAVRSLGVDATVNDRNDICVGKEKIGPVSPTCCTLGEADTAAPHVSGSAYKIVKDRAYHHGTMLISTRLDTLGELLRSGKDTMETRGVASVRSPVCNLQQYHPSTTHEKFVDAMVHAFRQEYAVNEEANPIHEDDYEDIPYIREGMEQLKTWDWAFGQTPEFTYKIQKSFPWGSTSAELRSKHGIILSCTFVHSETESIDSSLLTGLEKLAHGLEGEKYGFVDESVAQLPLSVDERVERVWQWLKEEMDV
ncbi:Lipoyltransferase and lipoate-protein ligase [Trametes sanguinea]|nr:Lipoyltransferase and lipoate-protein ligase [Trametes sanguinea]